VPFTFRVKARRYPPWHYAIAGVFSLLGSAFWAWLAYSALAVTLSVAKQVFIVFAVLPLLFLGLIYIAYKRQFRDHRVKSRSEGSVGLRRFDDAGNAVFRSQVRCRFPCEDPSPHHLGCVDRHWRIRLGISHKIQGRVEAILVTDNPSQRSFHNEFGFRLFSFAWHGTVIPCQLSRTGYSRPRQ
jgi:hypothetical protein